MNILTYTEFRFYFLIARFHYYVRRFNSFVNRNQIIFLFILWFFLPECLPIYKFVWMKRALLNKQFSLLFIVLYNIYTASFHFVKGISFFACRLVKYF